MPTITSIFVAIVKKFVRLELFTSNYVHEILVMLTFWHMLLVSNETSTLPNILRLNSKFKYWLQKGSLMARNGRNDLFLFLCRPISRHFIDLNPNDSKNSSIAECGTGTCEPSIGFCQISKMAARVYRKTISMFEPQLLSMLSDHTKRFVKNFLSFCVCCH